MQAGSQQLQDVHDQTSHCWSFGSVNLPSSQSMKISIGVMADSLPKRTFEASKEDDTARLDAERVRTAVRSPSRGKGKVEEMTATKQPKQTEAKPMNSPWITTKSVYQKGTTSQAVLFAERDLDFPASGRGKLDRAKNSGLAYSGHRFTNDTSVLQLGDDKLKKFNGVVYERKKKKDGTAEKMQDFTFPTVQDVLMPDTEEVKNKENTAENGRTVNLRLKLREILGTVSPPNDHYSKSPTHELGTKVLNPVQDPDKTGDTVVKPRQSYDWQEQKSDQRSDILSKSRKSCDKGKQKSDPIGDALFKPRQNSDTIETDSDCPDHRVERPVTRSLTRRRASTKVQKKTTKSDHSSGDKLKCQDKKVSSHEDGFSRGLRATVGGSSSMSIKKKTEKKFRVKPLNLFDERDILDKTDVRDIPAKIQQVTHRTETPLPSQKLSTLGKTRDSHSHGHISDKERKYPGMKENITKSNSHNSPLISNKDYQYGDFEIPEERDQQEDIDTPPVRPEEIFGSTPVRNFVNQPDGLRSPTLGFNTPESSSSLGSMLKADLMGKVSGFRSMQSKKSDCYGDEQRESSDDGEKLEDSLIRKASSSLKEKEASQPEASSGDRHLGSSEEDSPTSDEFDRCRESGALFRETRTAKKPKLMCRPANRLRSHKINVQLNHTETLSPSGNVESNWIPRSSENNQVDGLTRALELLAMELEKIKSKIKAVTSKKSSEILVSVAEDVHLQLKNVESHIQTDMGKLKNLSKLKRKRVETRFEEQQERLQSIYVKFKEQINQHLLDCKSTFEGLEVEQIEFKATLEKRKKSHGKLLLQVEEAIEILLNDAQRRISSTHESARGKMLQLKQVLALCLKEDILS